MAFPTTVALTGGQRTTVWAAIGKLSIFIAAYFSALTTNVNTALADVKTYVDTAVAGVVGGMTYKGVFDASGGIYPATPTTGFIYLISVAGTVSGTVLDVGDHIIYNGTTWDKIDNTEATTVDASSFGTQAEWGL